MTTARDLLFSYASDALLFPHLPQRSPYSTGLARLSVALPDFFWADGYRSWVVQPRPTRAHWRILADSQRQQEIWADILSQQSGDEPLTLVLPGPLTVLSHVELPSGHWMLADHGARRDCYENFCAMIENLSRLWREMGRPLQLVLDESAAQDVCSHQLRGAYDAEHFDYPGMGEQHNVWRKIAQALPQDADELCIRYPAWPHFPDDWHTLTREIAETDLPYRWVLSYSAFLSHPLQHHDLYDAYGEIADRLPYDLGMPDVIGVPEKDDHHPDSWWSQHIRRCGISPHSDMMIHDLAPLHTLSVDQAKDHLRRSPEHYEERVMGVSTGHSVVTE